MPTSNGPYLSYAVICEKMLHESDGALSLIRLIDRVTVRVMVPEGTELPPEIPPSQLVNVKPQRAKRVNTGWASSSRSLRFPMTLRCHATP